MEDKISEFLKNLKHETGNQLGKVPEGYFEDFEKKLMGRISDEKWSGKSTKIKKINSYLIMGIAASFLLLLLASTWYFRNSNPFDYNRLAMLDVEKGIFNLSDSEKEEYLLADLENIPLETLAEGLKESEINILTNEKRAQMCVFDSLPPPIQKNVNPGIKSEEKNLEQKNNNEELEDDIADEIDLDELLKDLSDQDFKKLENALLKTPGKNLNSQIDNF